MKDKIFTYFKTRGIFVLGIVILGIICLPYIKEDIKAYETYEQAEKLIVEEKYEKAREILKKIESKNIKDTSSLINLCEAHVYYDLGKAEKAYFAIDDIDFKHQTKEQLEKFKDFKKKVNASYDDYIVEETKKAQEEYRKKIKNGVPFVGMSESDIANTSLGHPSAEVRHNSEMVNGKRVTANLYDFKIGNKTIFIARCYHGTVKQVFDHRDDPVSYNRKTSSSSKKEKKKYEDEYNVNDYSDPEDFYDDNYDDFYDYYDAEDYYYEYSD